MCFLIVIANGIMHAQADPCSRRARHIINGLKGVQSWESFHSIFERFGSCDKARIAEEFSYTISRLLTRHWGDVGELIRLSAEDEGFKAFILRHIDENIPEEEGQLIERNCREHPPAGGEWLCRAVVDY